MLADGDFADRAAKNRPRRRRRPGDSGARRLPLPDAAGEPPPGERHSLRGKGGSRFARRPPFEGRRPPGGAPSRPRLRAGGPPGSHFLRPEPSSLRHRHVRRPVPRDQQRDPRARPRAHPGVRRPRHPRFSLRVRRPRPRPGPRTGPAHAIGRGGHPSRRRHHPRDVARRPGSPRDGRPARRARYRDPLRRGGRRDAPRSDEARRRDFPARSPHRRHWNPEDHRQRHSLHRSQLRLRDGLLRRGRRHPRRASKPRARATALRW